MSVCIYKFNDANKTEGVAILQMLNQLGDHGHHRGTETRFLKETTIYFGDSYKFFPLDRLGCCADTNTHYLKDDCLKFRLFSKLYVYSIMLLVTITVRMLVINIIL